MIWFTRWKQPAACLYSARLGQNARGFTQGERRSQPQFADRGALVYNPAANAACTLDCPRTWLDRCPPLPAVPMDGTEGTAEWTHLVDEQLGGRDVLV
jgi:hypothetical protein